MLRQQILLYPSPDNQTVAGLGAAGLTPLGSVQMPHFTHITDAL